MFECYLYLWDILEGLLGLMQSSFHIQLMLISIVVNNKGQCFALNLDVIQLFTT